jgi:hypothetical protein
MSHFRIDTKNGGMTKFGADWRLSYYLLLYLKDNYPYLCAVLTHSQKSVMLKTQKISPLNFLHGHLVFGNLIRISSFAVEFVLSSFLT